MRTRTTTFAIMFVAGAAFAAAEEGRQGGAPERCVVTAFERCGAPAWREERAKLVWDPNLAQWQVEHPRLKWDPNLAQWQVERRNQVWDPYLAQYRPRDARTDPPPPERRDERRDSRRRR